MVLILDKFLFHKLLCVCEAILNHVLLPHLVAMKFHNVINQDGILIINGNSKRRTK